MTKLDWNIAELNRILDEKQHRTEVEKQALKLMAEGKYLEATELLETLDNSLLKLREWPGEEQKEEAKRLQEENKKLEQRITNMEKALQCWQYETQLLLEFCRSVANKQGMALLSYQQLHSPSTDSSEKVRMLFEKLREFN